MNLLEQFRRARIVGTPIIAIRTADPAATMRTLMCSQKNNGAPVSVDNCPFLHWDYVAGIRDVRASNKLGPSALSSLGENPAEIKDPVFALIAAHNLPEYSVMFFANAHRIIGEQGVSQAIWNLRDKFKNSFRTLVMLCPTLNLPAEISQDVLMLDEPLPTSAELEAIVRDTFKSADLPIPVDGSIMKAVDAICGLAAFPAEQSCAMSITKDGMDLNALWERKRQVIEATPGLSVWRGGETFDDIGGCDNVKTFMRNLILGEEPPRAVVFQDEVEKSFAGSGTDLSGVTTEMEGMLLTWMEDHHAIGAVYLGPPGAAKSMVAKATGNTAGIPTIAFDLTSMKSSLVGDSTARLQQALKVVEAVSQGRALFLATANSIGALSPALRRRYSLGCFYFDLPSQAERNAIWQIYLKKYSLPKQELPGGSGWTGAEIRNCCSLAWRLRIPLKEAATYIVPVAISDKARIEKLRQEASGRFISASYSGIYNQSLEENTSSRSISLAN